LRRERWQRPAESKRRSRSVNQDWMSLLPVLTDAPQPTAFDPRSPQVGVF
jgi:hypothetical protein